MARDNTERPMRLRVKSRRLMRDLCRLFVLIKRGCPERGNASGASRPELNLRLSLGLLGLVMCSKSCTWHCALFALPSFQKNRLPIAVVVVGIPMFVQLFRGFGQV